MRRFMIHHLEDQPELMSWIPGSLLNWVLVDRPEWTDGADLVEDEEGNVCFRIAPNGDGCDVVYRVYESAELFQSRFPKTATAGDLVLLDVMVDSVEGGVRPHDPTVYECAIRAVGAAAVWVITAYRQGIPPQLTQQLSGHNILDKPVDVGTFIQRVARAFGWLNGDAAA